MTALSDMLNRWNQMFQSTVQVLTQGPAKPLQPTVTPTTQTTYDTEATDFSLHSQADNASISGPALARLHTKKVWEKGIGAKYNPNDTVNHVAQQLSLNQQAAALLSVPDSVTSYKVMAWSRGETYKP